MIEEGRFSRAMAKAEAAGKRGPAPEETGAIREPLKAAETPKEGVSFRRITGRAAQPAPNAVVFIDSAGEVATQVRGLRAKLLAINNGSPPRVITISSGDRQEGKTTLAFNLATTLSEIGAGRVLIVDGDMLGPSLCGIASVQAETGLTDVLSKDLSLDGNIYETAVPNLDILPTRAVMPEDDMERLLHQSCGKLLKKLRDSYAFVIVDTPPVRASSHACLFAKHSDGTLLVARLERTSRHVVKRAVDELVKVGAKLLGCVLTHQKHHIPTLIYRLFGTPPGRYYGYGYGYDYGYRYGHRGKDGGKRAKDKRKEAGRPSPG